MKIMNELLEIEQIKKMKYRYFRYLDCKQFEAMEDCFVENASSSYDSARHAYQSRDAILGFLSEALSSPRILHQHHGHHPEIEITSETTATGIWYMDDTVHILDYNLKVRGNGIYWDEYVKEDGQWKYQHIGYERVWEYSEELGERKLTFKSMFDEAELERRAGRVKRDSEPPIVYWEAKGGED